MDGLAEQLRVLRARTGLRQRAVAAEAGIGYQLLSDLECGRKRNPTIDTLCKLAPALGVSLAELVDPAHAINGKRAAG